MEGNPIVPIGRTFIRKCSRTIWLELSTYCGIHNPSAMCSDRVGYVTDVDCVQMLVVTGQLYKYLKEKKKCVT